MGPEITFGHLGRAALPTTGATSNQPTFGAQYYQPATNIDQVDFQYAQAQTSEKRQNNPIPATVLQAPAQINGVHYSRSIPIQQQGFQQQGNGQQLNTQNGLPYLAAIPAVPLPSQVAPHVFAGQNGPPYATNIKAPGNGAGGGAVAPIINNINNNNYYAPVTTNIQTNTNNGNWYGNGSGKGIGDGNAKAADAASSAGKGNGPDLNSLKDLMNPAGMAPPPEAAMPKLPPQAEGPKPPTPPQKPAAPTATLGSTLEHDTVMDLNKKLNSKDPNVRAQAAMEFYKILELKPDLADLESPYRPLVEAFMVKILRDPDSVVRQPGLLAFETGLFHYPNQKLMGIMKELAAGEGLNGLEPDIVKNILASEKPEEEALKEKQQKQTGKNSSDLAPQPNAAGGRLNLQESGYPIPENPLEQGLKGMHSPAVTAEDLYRVPENPMAQMPAKSKKARAKQDVNIPTPGPGVMDITQFMTPENLDRALAMMPPELQNDPKMRELMTNPQMLTEILNSDPTLKSQANAMVQGAMSGQAMPMPAAPKGVTGKKGAAEAAPSHPMPDFSKMNLAEMMTPENIQMAMQYMPPELKNDPMMKQVLENPAMLQEMIKAMPPEELAMAEKMVKSSPLDLNLLPQNIHEAKQLGYSNVAQGNQAFDGIGYPLPGDPMAPIKVPVGNRLDVTSKANQGTS